MVQASPWITATVEQRTPCRRCWLAPGQDRAGTATSSTRRRPGPGRCRCRPSPPARRPRPGSPPRWDGGHPAGAAVLHPARSTPARRPAPPGEGLALTWMVHASPWITATVEQRTPGRRCRLAPGQVHTVTATRSTRRRPARADAGYRHQPEGLALDHHHGGTADTRPALPSCSRPGSHRHGDQLRQVKAWPGTMQAIATSSKASPWITTTVGRADVCTKPKQPHRRAFRHHEKTAQGRCKSHAPGRHPGQLLHENAGVLPNICASVPPCPTWSNAITH